MSDKDLSPMQEEVLKRADSIMASLSDTVSRSAEFVQGQVPEIALQYLTFGRVFETMNLLMALGTALFGIWLIVNVGARNTLNLNSKQGDYLFPDLCRISAGFVGLVVGVASVHWTILSMKSFLLVWFAPKVWLIQEIARLVK